MSQQGTLQDLHILAPAMTQVDDKAGGKSRQLAWLTDKEHYVNLQKATPRGSPSVSYTHLTLPTNREV